MRVVLLEEHGAWDRYAPVSQIETLQTRGLRFASEWALADGSVVSASCLRCSQPACRRLALHEVPPMAADVYYEVCPVRAIASDEQGVPMFLPNCVHCGLCALRCPFGAIHLQDDGRPEVSTSLDSLRLMAAEDVDPSVPSSVVSLGERTPRQVLEPAWAPIDACLMNADAFVFYPLVARLVSALGLPTVDARGGDTSLRMDAVGLLGGASVPMEIKSYRESHEVNIKAVQQAFENKVIALSSKRGHIHQTDYDAASLAIGYAYPADRSGVMTLIQDYAAAFDIRIGIVTVRDLYLILVGQARLGATPDAQRLATFEGVWS